MNDGDPGPAGECDDRSGAAGEAGSGTAGGAGSGTAGDADGNDGSIGSGVDGANARADLNRKVQRLHDVATRMQSAGSPAAVHELTVEAAVDILGFDWCGFLVVREGHFELAAVSEDAPVDPGDRPLPVDEGVTGECYRTGESAVTTDAHADPDATPTQDEFRAGLTVPVGDWGVFQCIASVPGFFDENDLEIAELLVAHARGALGRIEQTRRLERLHGATRRLMSAETREEVASVASDTASAVLEFPLNAVFLYDGDADTLVPVAASDRAREVFGTVPRIGPGEGIAWRVFRDGETAVYDDVREAPVTYDPETPTRSELLAPLDDHGVLVLGSTVPGEFDDDDVAVAETLAANITAALDRADRERELRRHRRDLQRQNERLDRFASVVSHDLRNPLFGARGSVELARRDHDSEPLAVVASSLDRMEAIIDDALTLAREGRTVDDPEPVDLGSVVDECWNRVDAADAALVVEDDRRIRADPARLGRVFENLFRNSVEHGSTDNRPSAGDPVEHGSTGDRPEADHSVEHGSTGNRPDVDPGGDTPAAGQECPAGATVEPVRESSGNAALTVRVGALDDGFYVADDGPGIPEEQRGDVFEAGHSTDPEGTGLGLAIVEEIVEAHGWSVAVTESAAGGARFEVTGVEVVGE